MPNTVLAHEKNLKLLAQKADLFNTTEVELAIARYKLIDRHTRKVSNRPASNAYKAKLCDSYAAFLKYHKMEWEKPVYTPEPKAIQPPTKERTAQLVSAARYPLSMKIDIMRQTGYRPEEIQGEKGLRVEDFHPDQPSLTNRNTKKCNARPALPITPELAAQISEWIRGNNLTIGDKLFEGDSRRFGEHYRRFRNKLAEKLKDPTIATIRLYDLRHYYATEKLRKTQNAEIVRQLMGHKNLNTTQKYLHLLANLFTGEWIVEGTTDKERIKYLLLSDFRHECTAPDGTMFFRKPK
jgi:integrase